MGEPTFASLNPSLLARKGGAKPAMRPQHGLPAPHMAAHEDHLEDLGWNDMGTGDSGADNVVNLAPAADNEVHRQQQEIAERVVPAPPAPAAPRARKAAVARGKRAAFTLRLDSERHLKLRLACTVKGRSAQQIVTEALDRLLGEMPDVAALAAHVNKN